MLQLIGEEIPESCYSVLSEKTPVRENLVITLLTVDETGFPRVCLLSPFQVVSKSRSRIYLEVYPSSHTKSNLDRNRKATLVIPESTGLIYVNGETQYLRDLGTTNEGSQSLYLMNVRQVSRDSSEEAPITAHMAFDTSVIAPSYQKNFLELVANLA